MKYWRLYVICTLILAMPISSWANVLMSAHCHTSDNTSHSMHANMDEGKSMHVHVHVQDQAVSQDTNEHANCECGCDGEINCSVSGCSAAALLNVVGIDSIHLTQTMYRSVVMLAVPPDPQLLFRPPITLS